jgi:uncharacterized protein (DUF1330 family)
MPTEELRVDSREDRAKRDQSHSLPDQMTQPLVLVVGLWIAPGRDVEFDSFERAALAIVARHGGSLMRRVGLRDGLGSNPPNELHVLMFPSREAYDRYRDDPELTALAPLRARAILRTVIWEGADLPPFADVS